MTKVLIDNVRSGKPFQVNVVRIISQHKRLKLNREGYTNSRPKHGKKRVQAIVKFGSEYTTMHIDVPKDFQV